MYHHADLSAPPTRLEKGGSSCLETSSVDGSKKPLAAHTRLKETTMKRPIIALASLAALGLYAVFAVQIAGIASRPETTKLADFDLVNTNITKQAQMLVFTQTVSGKAGESKPPPTGHFAGSEVYSYVWPTSLDSSAVGFEAKQGVLALAATFHPDFDDGANGAKNRSLWHTHWVVLVPDDACGKGNLKVKDIPEGAKPKMPPTWPGVGILIDSPNYPPSFSGSSIQVRVPLKDLGFPASFKFDGVTAGLRVNANLHAPLLCVADVFKVASGNLSLPGQVSDGK
jgi:hypothetical protein